MKKLIAAITMALLICSVPQQAQAAATTHDRGSAYTDLVGKESGISFQMFDYSEKINFDSNGNQRAIAPYFNFRRTSAGDYNVASAENYDEDGFTKNHATVERTLGSSGYPVLSLTRDASGKETKINPHPTWGEAELSLGYLFKPGDHAVTSYDAENTLLRYDYKTGYYEYNSALHAADFDTNTKRFQVYEKSERGIETAGCKNGGSYADFFPFNYGIGTSGTINEVPYIYEELEVNYWFGMSMETEFMQPKQGKIQGQDMVFEFSGDDDVWVFVDDVLVLDIGGTHGVVTGSINFATGKVEAYLDWDDSEADRRYNTTIQECFEMAGKTWDGSDYKTHTLKYFYLERGSSCANCHIKFNLQTIPENSLALTKSVEGINTEHTALLKDQAYKVQLYVQEQEGEAYKLWKNFQKVGGSPFPTDSDGTLQLKDDEIAIAIGLPVTAKYYVKELETDAYNVSFWKGALDVTNPEKVAESTVQPVVEDEQQTIVVKNSHKTENLIVSKKVTGGMGELKKQFDFQLKIEGLAGVPLSSTSNLEGEKSLVSDAEGNYTFGLKHNETITIVYPYGYQVQVSENNYAMEGYRTSMEAISQNEYLFVNHKETPVPTGISEQIAPYLMMISLGIGGLWISKRALF